jgi:hypothetical protein
MKMLRSYAIPIRGVIGFFIINSILIFIYWRYYPVIGILYIIPAIISFLTILLAISYLSRLFENKAHSNPPGLQILWYSFLLFPFVYLKTFIHEMGHLIMADGFYLPLIRYYISPFFLEGNVTFAIETASNQVLSLITIAGSLAAILVSVIGILFVLLSHYSSDLKLVLYCVLLTTIILELHYWVSGVNVPGTDAYLLFEYSSHFNKKVAIFVLNILSEIYILSSTLAITMTSLHNELFRLKDTLGKDKYSRNYYKFDKELH